MRPRRSPVIAVVLSVGLIAFSVAGCGEPMRRGGQAFGPCYPPPPHTARVQYLRSFSGGSDFGYEGGSVWRHLFGGPSESHGNLVKPHGLAATAGKLYVCDSAQGGIFVFDFAAGSFDRWDAADDALSTPVAVRVTDAGQVQVCDAGRGAVVSYDSGGRLLGLVDLNTLQETSPGASLPEAFRPVALADGPEGTTAVLNAAAHRVELIDLPAGRHVGSWAGPGSGSGKLYYPAAMTRATDGDLLVSDRMNRRVVVLGPDGSPAGGFGDAGDQPGYIAQPRGVAVDEYDTVYLVDSQFPAVQLFDREGEFLMGLGYGDRAGADLSLPAGICLDRSCLPYFTDWIRPGFEAEYLIFVSDQLGAYRVHVYAFGSGATPPAEEAGTAVARNPQ